MGDYKSGDNAVGIGRVVDAGGAIGVDAARVGCIAARREPPAVSRTAIFLDAVGVAGVVLERFALGGAVVCAEARHGVGQGEHLAGYAAAALQSKGRVHDFALKLFGQAVVNRGHFVVEGAAGVVGRDAEGGFAVDIFSHQHHAAGYNVVYVGYFVIGCARSAVTARYADQRAQGFA